MPNTDTNNTIKFSEHQTAVDSLIGVPPGCLLHSGIMMIAMVVLTVLVAASFIKYPDKFTAQGILTNNTPPIEHYNIEPGVIKEIYVAEGDFVKEKQALLYIQNTADAYDVMLLKMMLIRIDNANKWGDYLNIDFEKKLSLGELQSDYAKLELVIDEFKTVLRESAVYRQVETIEREINKIKSEHNVLTEEQKLSQKEVELKQKNVLRNSELNRDGVISDVDLEKVKIELLTTQKTSNNLSKGIIQNGIREEQLQLEIFKLTENRNSSLNQHVFKIQEIKNQLSEKIKKWDNKYIVRAGLEGRISFPTTIVEKKMLTPSTLVCSVIPDYEESAKNFAQVISKSEGVGKISKGHKVIIKFDAYPFKEFGTITSIVEEISPVPIIKEDGNIYYSIKIPVENELWTSYKKQIPYKPNLSLMAEIITKDKSVLQRIFEQLLNIINRQA